MDVVGLKVADVGEFVASVGEDVALEGEPVTSVGAGVAVVGAAVKGTGNVGFKVGSSVVTMTGCGVLGTDVGWLARTGGDVARLGLVGLVGRGEGEAFAFVGLSVPLAAA